MTETLHDLAASCHFSEMRNLSWDSSFLQFTKLRFGFQMFFEN